MPRALKPGMTTPTRLAALLAAAALVAACGGADDTWDTEGETFDQTGKFLTSDAAGRKALPVNLDTATEVWKVTTIWGDTTSAAARAAGMAWPANSGLRWDQKYQRWIDSMEQVTGADGRKTFVLTTPYGKTIQMPALECSEQALMLRSMFASWYGLAFFVEARDSAGARIFLGHFGFRSAAGRYKGTPNFKTAYSDYSSRGSSALTNWPKDSRLRARHLSDSDFNNWLGEGAGFGTWADEALLNKRVAYFLLYLLDYFGSMNLADDSNGFHVKPEGLQAGDFLLERWQRVGIGHTLLVKEVTRLANGKLAAELASGSMPRRQPVWEDPARSRYYFMSDVSGGEGEADDGTPYAKLGGGLRRFRTTQNIGGYWVNNVPSWDNVNAVEHTDYAAIAARPARFGELLADVPPEQKLQMLTDAVNEARATLRTKPASCSNRTRREMYFTELKAFAQRQYGWSAAEVDRRFRATDDYYFPELKYTDSPSCCWNSTTPEMYSLVDRANRARWSQNAQCLPPVTMTKANWPFFKQYAERVGEGAKWKSWSEDEPCAQRGNADDTQLAATAVAYCSIRPTLESEGR
jgi:hypothetical protein